MISFEGGSYTLGHMSVPGGQTMMYDIRGLRDSQRPDVNGNVIPVSVSEGKVHWSIQDAGIKSLIGRLEQADMRNGLSTTVACGICCPDSHYRSWVSPDFVTGSIGDTQQFRLFRQYQNCFGDITSPSQDFTPNWSCDNTSVATIDSFSGFATAVGVGRSRISNHFLSTIYTDEGSYCSESTGMDEATAICSVGGWSEMWYKTNSDAPAQGNCIYVRFCGAEDGGQFMCGHDFTKNRPCTNKYIKEVIPINGGPLPLEGECDPARGKEEFWATKFGTCGIKP
jgi:hypothetical protein